MTTAHQATAPEHEAIYLDHVTRQTYDALRRETADRDPDLIITYDDDGDLFIGRRGRDVGAIHGVSWKTYERLLHDLRHRRLKLTYDNGRLTIVSPSHLHDRVKGLIGRMITMVALEWGTPLSAYGGSTWRRPDLRKGLESDECFYIQNEARVRGKDKINLKKDPPPDLVVEVEVTRHDIARLDLYAAMGVTEIWHWKRERITALKLEDGKYVPVEFSVAFPALRPAELERFLAMRHTADETTLIRSFQEWVRTLPRT